MEEEVGGLWHISDVVVSHPEEEDEDYYWYTKSQATVGSSTFGAALCDTKAGVDIIDTLSYKLWIFGLQKNGSAYVLCDNKAV